MVALPEYGSLVSLLVGGVAGVAIYAALTWLFMRDRLTLALHYVAQTRQTPTENPSEHN